MWFLTSMTIYQSRGLLLCINARGVVSLGHCFFRKRRLTDHSFVVKYGLGILRSRFTPCNIHFAFERNYTTRVNAN